MKGFAGELTSVYHRCDTVHCDTQVLIEKEHAALASSLASSNSRCSLKCTAASQEWLKCSEGGREGVMEGEG